MKISTLNWVDLPDDYDPHGNIIAMSYCRLDDGTELRIGYDRDDARSYLAARPGGHGSWKETSSMAHWPYFDALFGRIAWRLFVSAHQSDVR